MDTDYNCVNLGSSLSTYFIYAKPQAWSLLLNCIGKAKRLRWLCSETEGLKHSSNSFNFNVFLSLSSHIDKSIPLLKFQFYFSQYFSFLQHQVSKQGRKYPLETLHISLPHIPTGVSHLSSLPDYSCFVFLVIWSLTREQIQSISSSSTANAPHWGVFITPTSLSTPIKMNQPKAHLSQPPTGEWRPCH